MTETMTFDSDGVPEPPVPEAVEIDSLKDWVNRLKAARDAKALAEEIERECKDMISGFLAEREASIGLVNGIPAVRSNQRTRRYAPTVALMDKFAPDIQAKYGKTVTYTELVLIK
jgi:hypothetical protein